jgi:hypothetical protein
MVNHIMEVRESEDMLHWSAPVQLTREGELFGEHYVGIYDSGTQNQTNVIEGDTAVILTNGNGTDVTRYEVELRS